MYNEFNRAITVHAKERNVHILRTRFFLIYPSFIIIYFTKCKA